MKPPSPSRRPSLTEEICRELHKLIRDNHAKKNTWLLPEMELARQFNVSRTVVREAVKQLESQGLLEVHHGVGVQIVDRLHKPIGVSVLLRVPESGERLRNLMEVRLILEPEIARLAAERIATEQVKMLRDLQEKLKTAQHPSEAVEYDVEFHRVLAVACGNEVLILMMESVAELQKESRFITLSHAGATLAYDHHARILAAVERGKGDEAAEAMTHHLKIAAQELSQQLSRKSKK